MNFQKRLINIFKSFVQKVFLPQISKSESVLSDWNKFNTLLSSQNLNINQLQSYIDSLGSTFSQYPHSYDKKQSYLNSTSLYRKKQQPQIIDMTQQLAFNPNKTFGGEKTKIINFPVKPEFDQRKNNYLISTSTSTPTSTNNNRQEFNKYRTSNNSTNLPNSYRDSIDNAPIMLESLGKLYKNFMQNQQKIQNLTQGGGNPLYS